jgi:hypothetical protein
MPCLCSLDAESPNETQAELFTTFLVDALADDQDGGNLITAAELVDLFFSEFQIPSTIDLSRFANRWNRSVEYWNQGILSVADWPANSTDDFLDLSAAQVIANRLKSSRASARREGFNGVAEAWVRAIEVQQFEEARKLAGVCASVRIRIQQELTLTRIGFEAQLEILNDGSYPLEDVSVSLRANSFGNITVDSTDLFVMDEPQLSGLDAVDGTSSIDAESKARVTWLIIPLTEAAPVFETKYDIGGILTYTIQGVDYIQNLATDTITVQPDPQLHLTYFHSRVAYSDDPFTRQVEPALPFHLALLIENRGYGEARNLEIVSSQPEIIENEKGLLVDFSIIGARLGNSPLSRSLNINFGTIEAQSNAVGVWDLVSTLRGDFYNFSASFQYNGAINDDRLSLIESVDIFELTHLVRVTGEHPAIVDNAMYIDDELDDFLVNVIPAIPAIPGELYLPDTVYTSDTRLSNFSVSSVIDKGGIVSMNQTDDSIIVQVEFSLSPEERAGLTDWVYIRLDDPLFGTGYILQTATRTDFDYTLIPGSNSWQTSWIDYLIDGSQDDQPSRAPLRLLEWPRSICWSTNCSRPCRIFELPLWTITALAIAWSSGCWSHFVLRVVQANFLG